MVLSSRQEDENTRAPAVACMLAVFACRTAHVDRLWCSAVEHPHSSSNDADLCVVVRSHS